jgi:hypothetical protein
MAFTRIFAALRPVVEESRVGDQIAAQAKVDVTRKIFDGGGCTSREDKLHCRVPRCKRHCLASALLEYCHEARVDQPLVDVMKARRHVHDVDWQRARVGPNGGLIVTGGGTAIFIASSSSRLRPATDCPPSIPIATTSLTAA